MFGRREIVGVVSEVQNEVVGIKDYVDNKFNSLEEAIGEAVVQTLDTRLKVLEQRINRRFDNLNKSQSNNVIEAINRREKDEERREMRQAIKSKLSILYAEVQEAVLFEESERGNKKLTKEGEAVYKMLYEVVMMLANYHGSNSHMKIANRTTYNRFVSKKGIPYELVKRTITLNNGVGRESVFADMFYRGVVAKFVKFLEDEFLNEKEAI